MRHAYAPGNPFNGFGEGFDQGTAMAQGLATQRAGNALAGGDYAGASGALYRSGQLEQGAAAQKQGEDHQAAEQTAKLKWMGQAADALSQVPDDGQSRQAALSQHVLPTLQAMGMDANALQALQTADLSDNSLAMFRQQVAKQLQIVNRGDGGYDVVDLKTGTAVRSQAGRAEPKVIGGYVYLPEDAQPSGQPAAPAPQAAPQGQPSADAVWAAMKQRESGGNGNAVSPKGAIGSTQMLPATAQAMAQKLGVQWRPELMRGNSPEALQYQDQLGRAYFDEGVQKYGGDLSKGASYYHGGPNTAIWGPKTQAYAQAVTGGVSGSGGQNPPMQGGGGGDILDSAPQIPGYRMLGRAKPEGPAKVREAPSGYEWNPDGTQRAIKGGPADPATKAASSSGKRDFAMLRKEFHQLDEVKAWKDVRASFLQVRTLAEKANPTSADDTALTFSFMKMLDPGSVVREGEFALVGKSAGLPDQVVMALAMVDKGKTLTPAIRQRLRASASEILLQRRAVYDETAGTYRQIAADLGANPDQLAEDPSKWRQRIQRPGGQGGAPAAPGKPGRPPLASFKR